MPDMLPSLPPVHPLAPRRLPAPLTERVGDAERSGACDLLQAHFTAGRLEPEEFDDRVGAAVRAKTHADLRRALRDLPPLGPPLPMVCPSAPAGRGVPDAIGVLLVAGASGIIGLMLLGSLVLGGGVFVFSVFGGLLACFVGAGTTWLVMRTRRHRPPHPPTSALR